MLDMITVRIDMIKKNVSHDYGRDSSIFHGQKLTMLHSVSDKLAQKTSQSAEQLHTKRGVQVLYCLLKCTPLLPLKMEEKSDESSSGYLHFSHFFNCTTM